MSDLITASGVALELQGTCDDLHEKLAEYPHLTEDDITQALLCLDIERCDVCSWWCETHELDENNCCEDCRD